MSKFLRVDFEKQPWGYARVGGIEMSASLSVHEVGSLGVAIGDVMAVSHVWGNAQYEVENVQGASHQIRMSSPAKMQRLLNIAQSKGWENLWLDNICINQEDDDEKSREVMRMGYVYRETKGTVILLDSTCSELLRGTMCTIVQFQGIDHHEAVLDEMQRHVDMEALADRCLEMVQDKWYERVWTMHESTSASRKYMAPVDEDAVYNVSGLSDCAAFLFRLLCFAYDYYQQDPRAWLMKNFINRWLFNARITMLDALAFSSQLKCSVMKDKVYGILGLIPNVSITPAYKDTSLEDLSITVMKECVNNLKEMDVVHLDGPKLEGMGKRMVPTWKSLVDPKRRINGQVVHRGNCTYDENVGLMVSKPRVFEAKIIAVIEPDQPSMVPESHVRKDFRALKEKLDDDQMVELLRGMMFVWAYPQYKEEFKAWELFHKWAHLASLPPYIEVPDVFHVLEIQYGLSKEARSSFLNVGGSIRGWGKQKTYLLGITKDNDCPCSGCRRTYISTIWSDGLVEDNLVVVDYGGHIKTAQLDGGRHIVEIIDDRIPLIVAELDLQEGVKYISTIVQDRGILHKSKASIWEAITIV